MSVTWKTRTLGSLCSIELGRTPSRSDLSLWDTQRETGNVWLSIADLLNGEEDLVFDSKEYVSDKGAKGCKVVRKGTLLVSFKLTLGRLAFAGRDLFTNEAIAALSIFDERLLSKEYLFWYLHYFDWNKAAEGDEKVKGKTLNKAKLKEVLIRVPPLPEQKRIVAILDEAFDAIATATANTEKNLANARALFDSHMQVVFSQCGQDWSNRPLGDICDLLGGFAFKSEDVVPVSETQLVRMGNLYGDALDLDRNPVFYPDIFASIYKRYILGEGDLIMSLTGTTGKEDYGYTVKISHKPRNLLLNQRIVKFDGLDDSVVDRNYLLFYLRSRAFLDLLYSTANGTRQRTYQA